MCPLMLVCQAAEQRLASFFTHLFSFAPLQTPNSICPLWKAEGGETMRKILRYSLKFQRCFILKLKWLISMYWFFSWPNMVCWADTHGMLNKVRISPNNVTKASSRQKAVSQLLCHFSISKADSRVEMECTALLMHTALLCLPVIFLLSVKRSSLCC